MYRASLCTSPQWHTVEGCPPAEGTTSLVRRGSTVAAPPDHEGGVWWRQPCLRCAPQHGVDSLADAAGGGAVHHCQCQACRTVGHRPLHQVHRLHDRAAYLACSAAPSWQKQGEAFGSNGHSKSQSRCNVCLAWQ